MSSFHDLWVKFRPYLFPASCGLLATAVLAVLVLWPVYVFWRTQGIPSWLMFAVIVGLVSLITEAGFQFWRLLRQCRELQQHINRLESQS